MTKNATTLTRGQKARLVEEISTPSGFINNLAILQEAPLELDAWQASHCDYDGRWSITNKSRQVGFSLVESCRKWSRAYLSGPRTFRGVFVSYNLEDVREKIRYVDELDFGLPSELRMKRTIDNKDEIEWENGNRVLSVFRARGKYRADIGLDEMAWMPDQDLIYNDCSPIMIRGGASLHIGSSPTAAAGRFHSIWTGAGGKYKNYKRTLVPWWCSREMVRNPAEVVRFGVNAIWNLPTEERVARFGSEVLIEIFDGMFLEDFRTEFECHWSDESRAFLSFDLLARSSSRGGEDYLLCDTIDQLRHLPGGLYFGVDIGRRHDKTEIKVMENPAGSVRIEERFSLTLSSPAELDFENQESILDKLFALPGVVAGYIDENGLGMQLAENMVKRWGSRAKAQPLSRTSKPAMATTMRMLMECGDFLFYPTVDNRSQLHSVKKVVTASQNVIYDVDKNEKHHADKFWAYALASFAFKEGASGSVPQITVVESEDEEVELDTGSEGFTHKF